MVMVKSNFRSNLHNTKISVGNGLANVRVSQTGCSQAHGKG